MTERIIALPGVRRLAVDRSWLVPVSAAVLLLVLGTYRLGDHSFWLDEASSWLFTSGDLGKLWHFISTGQANMSVYYVILHFWIGIGESEATIRFLSVLAAVSTVPVLFLVGRRLGGPVVGSIAVLVFALNPFVVRYAQEARGYTLALLTVTTMTWLLLRAMEARTARLWAAYGLLAGLGLYVHYFVGFVVVAHGIAVLIAPDRPRLTSLWPAAVPLALAAAPLPVIVITQGPVADWIAPVTPRVIGRALLALAGGVGPFAILVVVTLITLKRQWSSWGVQMVLIWLIAPLVLAVGISVLKPLFVGRYLAIIVPAIALLLGFGIASIRPRSMAAVAAAAVVVLELLALPGVYASPAIDWRSAAAWIARDGEPGDRMTFDLTTGQKPILYYLSQHQLGRLPTSIALETAAGPGHRVWVVFDRVDRDEQRRVGSKLRVHHELVAGQEFGGGAVVELYRPKPDPSPAP